MTATLPDHLRTRLFDMLTGAGRDWTPGQIAAHIDPRTVQTPALDLIDAELQRLLATPSGRLIISMPPQEGKSTRVARDLPIKALIDNRHRDAVTLEVLDSAPVGEHEDVRVESRYQPAPRTEAWNGQKGVVA